MSDEGHIDEMAAAFALGALEADERDRVERHLARCDRCRRVIDEASEVAHWLAYAAPSVAPPARLREELLRRLVADIN